MSRILEFVITIKRILIKLDIGSIFFSSSSSSYFFLISLTTSIDMKYISILKNYPYKDKRGGEGEGKI